MAEEELRQDARTVEQIVDDMNLFDDDLMSMVFDGNLYGVYYTDGYIWIWDTDLYDKPPF